MKKRIIISIIQGWEEVMDASLPAELQSNYVFSKIGINQ